MTKEKKLYISIIVLAVCLTISLIFNFTHTAKLKNGEEVAVKVDKKTITADTLYSELKEKYSMNILVDKIDHMLLDTKYKTDDSEKQQIESQIKTIKANYDDEEKYLQAIKSYYGVDSEDEFKEMLSLEYKRTLAVKDYIKDNVITDTEVNNYYESKIIGDVKASHILIKSDAKDSDSDEVKQAKEQKALEKAKEIIAKLNKGEDFAKLAKKYSDDEGTKDDGGNLGYFNTDDNYSEEFVMAAAALENGKYTEEPLKTEYGYEIILKVAEKNKAKLDDVKDDIKTTLAEEKLNSSNSLYYESLFSYRESKVTFKDSKLENQYKSYKKRLLANLSSNS